AEKPEAERDLEYEAMLRRRANIERNAPNVVTKGMIEGWAKLKLAGGQSPRVVRVTPTGRAPRTRRVRTARGPRSPGRQDPPEPDPLAGPCGCGRWVPWGLQRICPSRWAENVLALENRAVAA